MLSSNGALSVRLFSVRRMEICVFGRVKDWLIKPNHLVLITLLMQMVISSHSVYKSRLPVLREFSELQLRNCAVMQNHSRKS